MSDELMELPDGWAWVRLDEMAEVGTGATPLKSNLEYYEGGSVPWVTSGLLNKLFITEVEEKITELAVKETNAKVFPKHTLLIAMYGEGKTRGKVSELLIEAATNQACAGLTFNGAASATRAYIKLFLEKNYNDIRRLSSGGVQPNLNLGIIKATQAPLPPLNEQKRIVAAIASLRERSQKARSALSAIPELCDKFRQSVLAAAFRGDLTADWREQNPDVEPASVLLERIKEKRLAESKSDKQRKVLEELYSYKEEYGTEQIPNDWQYTALEKLCYSFQYGTSAKSSPEGKVPVLRMGNLQRGEINWRDLAYTNDDEEITKYSLKPGDVLFNRTNSPELVGKTSIYRGEQPAIFAGYLIKVDNSPELGSEYLNYCLNTNYAKDYCWKVKTDGVSQSNINAQKLAKFEIPLCSLQEQLEIVRQIRYLFEVISQIEHQYQGAESYLSQLDRSILAKAFRGELVEQDPNDEPASVLLERIGAERAQAQGKAKKPGKRGQRTIKVDPP